MGMPDGNAVHVRLFFLFFVRNDRYFFCSLFITSVCLYVCVWLCMREFVCI
eukprot:GDKH01019458.1.p5 GENE.GDKH01019458.1~~GDKH01019458.1.p5  ORF type:complete len:51 (-),score=1.04 GDKH01019458.1:117-269(-)